MEIKRQITGMMRLLSDKTSRVYQRVGTEQDSLTREPQDGHLTWLHQPVPLSLVSENHQSNSWHSAGDPGPSLSSTSTANGPGSGQYTRINRNKKKLPHPTYTTNQHTSDFPADIVPPAVPETPCCMCNCKGTLQAILQELRAMRKLMQTQKGQQEQAASPCQLRLGPGPAPRHRPRKKRPIYKVAQLAVSSSRRAALISVDTSRLLSEVRLAEDYDVFISKAQLDSILVNYTRSGSLLFRKLVCAFFDDATLANSLPNGKRKRGLNDNRKGLDQNIVGMLFYLASFYH
uniref:Si:ch211-220f12.4 n=1 Tax=Mastacembelus armatus TaxID=205130 RepID=A0A3Q3L746_9TELE